MAPPHLSSHGKEQRFSLLNLGASDAGSASQCKRHWHVSNYEMSPFNSLMVIADPVKRYLTGLHVNGDIYLEKQHRNAGGELRESC